MLRLILLYYQIGKILVQYEAVIEIPKGEVLNIGRVAEQNTKTGALLKGDADQEHYHRAGLQRKKLERFPVGRRI